jgi:hypothetical protein
MDKKVQVFAVMRLDLEVDSLEDAVTVKEILPGKNEAATEVERLNRLNGTKGARYFFLETRYFPNGRKAILKGQTKIRLVK